MSRTNYIYKVTYISEIWLSLFNCLGVCISSVVFLRICALGNCLEVAQEFNGRETKYYYAIK